MYDRLVLILVETISWGKYIIVAIAAFFLLSGLNKYGYSSDLAILTGFRAARNLLSSLFAGSIITPILLPWIPGKNFSFKGFFIGFWVVFVFNLFEFLATGIIEKISWIFIIPALSSFIAMNYTGTSTYTFLSGARKEMRTAVPLQLTASLVGLILWITGRFV
ncbi:MAG: hypothetical protein A2161_19295 [Candidatus Schekmanbacteria bacterium RBG_13_48_7]|uniref:Uncharacterized protein n=1 Tax=Candidatus Schekmanbacteria bacterium RBG_13_48_7 TaxID=1817878 RepID=A0A1F7S9X0_9BACT|nr:MAG: hypothetical protein A2161_19295 [Candidatus Schekmanbacteria bacterium RBG_13_48_7]